MATNKSSTSKPASAKLGGGNKIKVKDKPPLPGTPRPLPPGDKPKPGAT